MSVINPPLAAPAPSTPIGPGVSPPPPPPPVAPPPPPVSPSPQPPDPPSPSPPPPPVDPPPPPPPVSPSPQPPDPPSPDPPTPVVSSPPPPSPAPPTPVVFSPPPPVITLSPPPPSRTSPPRPDVSSPPPPPLIRMSSPPPLASLTKKSSISTPVLVGAVAGGAVVLLILAVLLWICCRRGRRRRRDHPPVAPASYGGDNERWQQQQHISLPLHESYALKPKPQYISPQPSSVGSQPPVSPSNLSSAPVPSPFSSSNYSSSDQNPHGSSASVLDASKSTFTYEELVMATDGFSDANLLGQGGFGYVHRGVLPSGKEVAVKQLKAGSGQGEREFQAEVEIITRVHHRHLVSLVGYCITGDRRLLVYEFVPNNTLEFHLHGKGRPTMDWSARMRIALGSAKGLAYLHEDCHPKIIHRDIKAANILLDYKFEAKVADFGLAKFFSDGNTHVTTRIMGTFGYLAPEYAASGKLTDKSDVFSFGVMLLELISGRRPIDKTLDPTGDKLFGLVDWARPLLNLALGNEDFEGLVDSRLQRNYDVNEMLCMVACAAASVRHSARHRPRMSQIVRVLEGGVSLEELNAGVTPGQSLLYGSRGSSLSSDNESGQFSVGKTRPKVLTFVSEENESGVYGGSSSEYGQSILESSSESPLVRRMDLGKDGYSGQVE